MKAMEKVFSALKRRGGQGETEDQHPVPHADMGRFARKRVAHAQGKLGRKHGVRKGILKALEGHAARFAAMRKGGKGAFRSRGKV